MSFPRDLLSRIEKIPPEQHYQYTISDNQLVKRSTLGQIFHHYVGNATEDLIIQALQVQQLDNVLVLQDLSLLSEQILLQELLSIAKEKPTIFESREDYLRYFQFIEKKLHNFEENLLNKIEIAIQSQTQKEAERIALQAHQILGQRTSSLVEEELEKFKHLPRTPLYVLPESIKSKIQENDLIKELKMHILEYTQLLHYNLEEFRPLLEKYGKEELDFNFLQVHQRAAVLDQIDSPLLQTFKEQQEQKIKAHLNDRRKWLADPPELPTPKSNQSVEEAVEIAEELIRNINSLEDSLTSLENLPSSYQLPSDQILIKEVKNRLYNAYTALCNNIQNLETAPKINAFADHCLSLYQELKKTMKISHARFSNDCEFLEIVAHQAIHNLGSLILEHSQDFLVHQWLDAGRSDWASNMFIAALADFVKKNPQELKDVPEIKELMKGLILTINRKAEELEPEIKNLPIRKSIFFQYNLTDHAMIYKITRRSDDDYRLEIFDTSGAFSYQKKGKRVVSPLVFDFKKEKIDKTFFSLISGLDQDLIEWLKSYPATLEDHLKVTFYKHPRLAYPAQQRGTCPYSSLMNVVKSLLSKEFYHAFRMHILAFQAEKVSSLFEQELGPNVGSELKKRAKESLEYEIRHYKTKFMAWHKHNYPLTPLQKTAIANAFEALKKAFASF